MIFKKFSLSIFVFLTAFKNSQSFFGKRNLFDIGTTLDDELDSFDLESVKEKWINQKLDNFDIKNSKTWRMRYLENRKFFKPGGPIFIQVGGESSVSPTWLSSGRYVFDMVKELNGIMFATEHRYYGESRPTKDKSSENLVYLTPQQAIPDLANFIRFIKNSDSVFANSGVILIGASYSGTLATWTKLKFPDLVDGVWASSAPLFAKMNFFEYNDIMIQSIRQLGGEKCLKHIRNAFKQIENYFAFSEPKFLFKLKRDFNLCEPLKLCRDTAHFFNELYDKIGGLVETHRYDSIQKACDFIAQDKFTDDVEALGAWMIQNRNGKCVDMNYDNSIKIYSNTSWESEDKELRQWIYQSCNSIGWYKAITSSNHGLGSKHPQIGHFVQICRDLFGSRFNERSISQSVDEINREYGGFDPQVTHVYSTHGFLDPWKAAGAQKDLDTTSPTFILKDYSHTADLRSISQRDSAEMRASKLRIKELIKTWLNLI